jgi:DNA (cytosine-5)-methyltransferase 1
VKKRPFKPSVCGDSLQALDLFAGAGGLSHGMEREGINVKWAVEFNKAASKAFKLNHPDARVFCAYVIVVILVTCHKAESTCA